jgi:hypothetical protein
MGGGDELEGGKRWRELLSIAVCILFFKNYELPRPGHTSENF